MSTITRERLQRLIRAIDSENYDEEEIVGWVNSDETLELARIALASLEAEAVAWLLSGGGAKNHVSFDSGNAYADPLREVTPLYTAPPAPVSVPAAMEMDDDFDSAFEHGKAVGWNAYRAASPTGGETSFTFDAVEARDFIDGGWSCQEYVELGRYQEALTDHSEDKLAMVDHSGDSNNMVEPVTTACELPDDFDFDRFNDVVWLEAVASNPHMHSLTTSTIAMVALELNRKLADCNSPVIPDDVRRMDWLVSKTVDVREPMVYGSHSLFWSQTITDEEDDYHATKLREQIDAAMAAEQAAAPQQEAE
ncbi:MAG: hypothetical protein E7B71_05100 [Enterobacter asburiae]|nr:hypothetical protein [Enterobacter asburiae]